MQERRSSSRKAPRMEAPEEIMQDDNGLRPRRNNAANYIAKKFLEDNEVVVKKKRPKQRRVSASNLPTIRSRFNNYPPPLPFDAFQRRPKRGRRPKHHLYDSHYRDHFPSHHACLDWDKDEMEVGHQGVDERYPSNGNEFLSYDGYEGPQHSEFLMGGLRNGRHSLPRREYSSQMEAFLDQGGEIDGEEEMPLFDKRSRFRDPDEFLDPITSHRRKSPVRKITRNGVDNGALFDDLAKAAEENMPNKIQLEAATALAQVGETIQQQVRQSCFFKPFLGH
ncbi:hypothetical protein Ciccas_005364 [Cichlidogyrus casuarinus]|uniref:Uncharacterized protein n=1 Tax=Cichlidogyrus casuarinus TaxID=1844966 RepID=A0ABD2Q8Y4_9PLAT